MFADCPAYIREAGFYGNFNNINLIFLGYNTNELSAVHLVKSYCIQSLFYGCEVWSTLLTPRTIIKCKLYGIMHLGKLFNVVGMKVFHVYFTTVEFCQGLT